MCECECVCECVCTCSSTPYPVYTVTVYVQCRKAPSGSGGSSEESMYPSGSEKFTMQLDSAEQKADGFYFAVASLFLFSSLLCNPVNVTLTGNSSEIPAVFN